jgi:hypothetical protein
MRHISVPFNLIRVGDVIDRPFRGGLDSFDVVMQVGAERSGEEVNQVIVSVSVGGERHRLEWRPCPDTEASMLDRVAEGCIPTPKGLQDFLTRHYLP